MFFPFPESKRSRANGVFMEGDWGDSGKYGILFCLQFWWLRTLLVH